VIDPVRSRNHPAFAASYPHPVARIAWTDDRLDDLANRMDAGFARIDADIRELRAELRTQIGALRAELRTEIGGLRLTLIGVGGGVIIGLVGVIAAIFVSPVGG
jgi:hypothetical protein